MKMCRMWRVETRKLYYTQEEGIVTFKDYLNPDSESLSFCPKYEPIGVGPYTLLKMKSEKGNNGHPMWQYANWLATINEPASGYYARFNYGEKKWTKDHLPPALWKTPVPGPIEDPYLREWWLNQPFEHRVQCIFGFPESNDFSSWFHTPGLIEWLAQNGFGLAEYRSKTIKHGLRQSVMRVDEPYQLMNYFPFKLKMEIGESSK